jgi:periplasmic protein TonB
MLKILTLLLFALFSLKINAQNISDNVVGTPPTDTTMFTKVDIEASVDRVKWVEHLTKSLGVVVDSASKVLKPGTYTVLVKFIVEKDGRISEANAMNDPGFGIGPMAAEIIRKGPRWKPAKINKRPVRSYFTQPVTFILTE